MVGKRKALIWGAGAAGVLFAAFLISRLLHPVSAWVTAEVTAPFGRFANSFPPSPAYSESVWLADDFDLQSRLFRAARLERENRELRGLLDIRRKNVSSVCAEVISCGGDGWWRIIRLGKGSAAGISKDDVVVCSAGLVGRIIRVTSNTSDVLLITDPNSRISCGVEGTGNGSRGILRGAGVLDTGTGLEFLNVVEPLELSYIRDASGIQIGRRILTNGLGGVFPAGIPVGRIVEVSEDSSLLYTRARIAPFVDFASLHTVVVLCKRGFGSKPR